jgi:hypothetical protein
LLDGVLEFCLQQACARRTAGHAATVDVLGRDEAMVREPGDCEHETANRQQCKSAAEVQAASQVVGAQRCHQLDARTRDHDGAVTSIPIAIPLSTPSCFFDSVMIPP